MFFADYDCMPCPEVVNALESLGRVWPSGIYGDDSLAKEAQDIVRKAFGLHEGWGVFFVPSGTAANRLALATLFRHSWESVVCAEGAHIATFEAGSIQSLGHEVMTVPQRSGRIGYAIAKEMIDARLSDDHQSQPSIISLANATEVGTIYHHEGLKVLTDLASSRCMRLFLDGARIANAFAATNDPEMSMKAFLHTYPFDAITVGMAKNGGLMGDIVIVKDTDFARVAQRYHKQFGYLAPRMQLYAAQVIALFTEDVWLQNAKHANAIAGLLAQHLKGELGIEPFYPLETNALFVQVPSEVAAAVVNAQVGVVWHTHELLKIDHKLVRFVTSWASSEEDIRQLTSILKRRWPS